MDLAQCSLNSITAREAAFDDLVDLASSAGFAGVGLWRDLLDGLDLRAASARLRDSGLRVTSICRGGMFPQPDEAARRERRDDNRRAIEQAQALDADCLVLVCGAAVTDLPSARRSIRDGIADLEPFARGAGVRLAIEPFHPMMAATRSSITSLTEANDLVEDIDSDTVGIALDSYHVWWDIALHHQIARASARLFCVQLADWVTPIHGELSSRGMPGEGCIDTTDFVSHVRKAGYQGLIEAEVLSDHWWAQPASQAVHAAAVGLQRI